MVLRTVVTSTQGALVGKIGSAFASSNTQHGGQETTIVCGLLPYFLHQGMLYAGLPYSFQGQMRDDQITGNKKKASSLVFHSNNIGHVVPEGTFLFFLLDQKVALHTESLQLVVAMAPGSLQRTNWKEPDSKAAMWPPWLSRHLARHSPNCSSREFVVKPVMQAKLKKVVL